MKGNTEMGRYEQSLETLEDYETFIREMRNLLIALEDDLGIDYQFLAENRGRLISEEEED
jgi:hypothetical protein